jgi:hypothetical protein
VRAFLSIARDNGYVRLLCALAGDQHLLPRRSWPRIVRDRIAALLHRHGRTARKADPFVNSLAALPGWRQGRNPDERRG